VNSPDTVEAGYQSILGYNEPGELIGDERWFQISPADWSPTTWTLFRALRRESNTFMAGKIWQPNRWKDLVAKFGKGDTKLISPGMALGIENGKYDSWLDVSLVGVTSPPGRNWRHETWFGAICPNVKAPYTGCKLAPEYLAVHIYTLSVQTLKDRVKQYHERFKLPIVVTEFACTVGRLAVVEGVTGSDADPLGLWHRDGSVERRCRFGLYEWVERWDDANIQAKRPSGSMRKIMSCKSFYDTLDSRTDWRPTRKYAWFGAMKNADNLHSADPIVRLMDDNGDLTALWVVVVFTW
jgi:hypothetical protein